MLASSSSALLAGCGQADTGPATASPGNAGTRPPGDVPGQTLRVPVTENDPNETSFFPLALDSTFATVVKEQPAGLLRDFVWEPGQWLGGLLVGADVGYTWIDHVDITSTEVTIAIRDDARWSDGHRITGRDIAVDVLNAQIEPFFRPVYASDRMDEPPYVTIAFDDFEVTDESVTYRSSAGFFDLFWEWSIRTWLGPDVVIPTHIEPYENYAREVIETVHRAQRGEIDPWDVKAWTENSAPTRDSLRRKHLDDRNYVTKFSDPENVLATGAWDLVELRGSEAFVFEPNPHHRNAPTGNVDTAILEYTPSAQRQRAALRADRLDYGSGVTPQHVVDSYPDHLTELRVPGPFGTGNELGLNFDHPALAQRPVRVALMTLLDQPVIAGNVHRTAAKPVTTPGGDCWDAIDYVSRDWIDEHLRTYATDRELAARLMREAGYARDGDGGVNGDGTRWVDADGAPLTFTLATDSETPRWEPAVASQLSEFGIPTSVVQLRETAFEDRVQRGEFPMWAARFGSSTSTAAATLQLWLNAAREPDTYGIFPEEQYETGPFSREGRPVPLTEERYDVFRIRAPPVGRPDGELRAYHPAALALAYFNNPPEAEFRRRVKVGIWLANWFLPTLPINKKLQQHFIDDTHWRWPKGTRSWEEFTGTGLRRMGAILASGTVRANPDNPEEANRA